MDASKEVMMMIFNIKRVLIHWLCAHAKDNGGEKKTWFSNCIHGSELCVDRAQMILNTFNKCNFYKLKVSDHLWMINRSPLILPHSCWSGFRNSRMNKQKLLSPKIKMFVPVYICHYFRMDDFSLKKKSLQT